MTDTLRLIGVTKDAQTAGPGKRFELFTKGCIRGVINPCEGCFNEDTWTFEGKYRGMSVEELVNIIDQDAWNRQVTFCGGEPILQAVALTKVAKRLKEIDSTFHIIMYTAYKLDTLLKYGLKFTWVREKHGDGMKHALVDYSSSFQVLDGIRHNNDAFQFESTKVEFTLLVPEQVRELMQYVNIIVDGDYKHDLRIPTAKYMNEGMFIGSNNQRVIYCKKSLEAIELGYEMQYESPEEYNNHLAAAVQCKCCGHVKPDVVYESGFCSDLCKERYEVRNKVMKEFGGA